MKSLFTASTMLFGLLPANATLFVVDGTFHAEAGIPANTLSGTMDITGGQITAVDLVVPEFTSHFTNIYFNQLFNGAWLISAYDNNQSAYSPSGEDYLTFSFNPYPGRFLIGFEQGKIVGGSVDHAEYDPITTVMTTTYYGLALTGTICPLNGCAPFPPSVVAVPSPVAGASLPGFLAMCLGFWAIRKKQHDQNRCQYRSASSSWRSPVLQDDQIGTQR